MKKRIIIIILFVGIIIFISFNNNNSSKSIIKLEDNLRKSIKLGYSDMDALLEINVVEDNIFLATIKDSNNEYIAKYINKSIEKDYLKISENLDSKYALIEDIGKSEINDYRFNEVIELQNIGTNNLFKISYEIKKDINDYKNKFNKENSNTFKSSSIIFQNKSINYYIEKNNNQYEILSTLQLFENEYLVIKLEHNNKKDISFDNLLVLLKTIFNNVKILQSDNLENKTNKIMYCTSQDKKSNYEEMYTHIMEFENNICIKYEMKQERKYYDYNTYLKNKDNLDSDTTYNDNNLSIITMIGDGHIGLNGNEEIYHKKTLEEAKNIAELYGNMCEIK